MIQSADRSFLVRLADLSCGRRCGDAAMVDERSWNRDRRLAPGVAADLGRGFSQARACHRAIPLLFARFRRSGNGICSWLFYSSIAPLITSYMIVLVFGDRWHGIPSVPVHDTIFQGSEFLICGFWESG